MEKSLTISRIREIEDDIYVNNKNINDIVDIKQCLQQKQDNEKLVLGAVHSLRRIFSYFIEKGHFSKTHNSELSGETIQKLQEYRAWLSKQYIEYKNEINSMSSIANDRFQVPAIRTILECVRIESKVAKDTNIQANETFNRFVSKLANGDEIEIDVLLLIKDEIFIYQDLTYLAMLVLKKEMKAIKLEVQQQSVTLPTVEGRVKNILDLLRVIKPLQSPANNSLATDNAEGNYFFPIDWTNSTAKESTDITIDVESNSDYEEEVENLKVIKSNTDRGSAKRKATNATKDTAKKRKVSKEKMSLHGQVRNISCYQTVYSAVWIYFFSLQLTSYQMKIALKHLPEHVIPYLSKPLMLADFLCSTFDLHRKERMGNNVSKHSIIISIVALENLFQIIVRYNLDYPNYFISLLDMCDEYILSSKLRNKFMLLLHQSLKSTNLPIYIVAAFIKRLFNISIRVCTPSAGYCIAQATWLMRRHQQCMSMIHADYSKQNNEQDSNIITSISDGVSFPGKDSLSKEDSNAIHSSLYEIELLQNHYLFSVSALSTSLQHNVNTTMSYTEVVDLDIKEFIKENYSDLIETEIKKSKKNCALDYRKNMKLFTSEDMVGQSFGF